MRSSQISRRIFTSCTFIKIVFGHRCLLRFSLLHRHKAPLHRPFPHSLCTAIIDFKSFFHDVSSHLNGCVTFSVRNDSNESFWCFYYKALIGHQYCPSGKLPLGFFYIALHRETAPASCYGNRGGSFTLWVLFQALNTYQLAFSFLKF